MTDFMERIDNGYPTTADVEKIMREAQAMRERVLREGANSFWAMVQRNVTRKPAIGETRHA